MNKNIWQKVQPHVLAIGIFLAVSVIYCMPALKSMVVNQHDVMSWKGMAQQSFEYKEKTGHFPLWTNSLFSGMPGYQVSMESKYNVTLAWLDFVFRFGLPTPVSLFFLSCVCFYILCMAFRMKSWVSIFGALAYSYASYNAILVAVGHTTKFSSMGYAPAVLAGFILLTQRKYVLGFITALTFSTLLFYQNHVQIVYYTFLVILVAALAFLIKSIKEKDYTHLLKTAGLSIAAIGFGVASYAVMLMPLNEYAKETMRGGRSELTINKPKDNATKGGLDKDYAFRWSYGIDESFTIVLPAFKGGSSGPQELGDKSKAVEAMIDARLPEQVTQSYYGALSAYWGPQTLGTSGPVYFGVIVVMLFIIGLFLVRDWHLGWVVGATVMGLILAWGSNASTINYFLFDHLPYYNKFRAPSIAMVIPQLTFSILATMALQSLLYGQWTKEELWKRLKPASIAIAVLSAVLVVVFFTAEYKSPNDKEMKERIGENLTMMLSNGQQPTEPMVQQASGVATSMFSGLVSDRKDLYGDDLLRTLIFILLGGTIIYFTARKKIAPLYAAIAFCALLLIDLLQVDMRYLNSKNYVSEEELMEQYTPNRADLQIKQDTGYFRVFDRDNDFSDNPRSAYHHNSVGGYHPAKLGLYQDLMQFQLSKGNMQIFNMLNTKYFIVPDQNDRQPVAIPNTENLGAVWFVKNIKYVNNADEEMTALDSIKPLDTVYIDKREQSKVTVTPQADSTAAIRLLKNYNDIIKYESHSTTNQFAVFSEIYYPYGWKAFIDGKEAPIARVDYTFRGLAIPAGHHAIEFRFEPKTKETGDLISLVIGLLSIVLVAGGLFWEWKQSNKAVA